ncbi:MAG: DUF421 domain-containing protein [Clostridia bacterium]|nr:DUF421 domain-containing protein [Clostridia bacterium]
MISIIIRTVFLYIVVTFAIRIMGKRQIGDMQPNELVITLLISEIAAIPLQDANQPLSVGIAAILVLIVLEILVSIFALKSFFIRKLLSGRSIVIIKNGVLDQKAMRDVRMTVLDLVELLRGQEVFDISEVDFAVLEVNGGLSVLPKDPYKNVTLKDLDIKAKKSGLPLPVISDGKIIEQSLKALNYKKSDLLKILKNNSLEEENVFLMTLDSYKNFNIIRKSANK